jgi:hypothetical protein
LTASGGGYSAFAPPSLGQDNGARRDTEHASWKWQWKCHPNFRKLGRLLLEKREMDTDLTARFDEAMMGVYQRARTECDYNAVRFLQMLHEHRGLETARILLRASKVSEGYVALWERKRLDLTVEAVILAPEWNALFSDDDRAIARKRLADYGYDPKAG